MRNVKQNAVQAWHYGCVYTIPDTKSGLRMRNVKQNAVQAWHYGCVYTMYDTKS